MTKTTMMATTAATAAMATTEITAAEVTATSIDNATADDATLGTTSRKTKSTKDGAGVQLEKNTQMPRNQRVTPGRAEHYASREKYVKPECLKDSS